MRTDVAAGAWSHLEQCSGLSKCCIHSTDKFLSQPCTPTVEEEVNFQFPSRGWSALSSPSDCSLTDASQPAA